MGTGRAPLSSAPAALTRVVQPRRVAWASWLAWACAALAVVFFGAGSGLLKAAATGAVPADLRPAVDGWWFRLTPVYGQAFAVVGALIVWRRPGNRVGWITIAIGLSWALYELAIGYDVYALDGRHHAAFAAVATSVTRWEWVAPTVLMLFVLPYYFPDGHAVSPRWRDGARAALVLATPVAVAAALVSQPAPLAQALTVVLEVLLVVCVVVAPASLVVRYRRATPVVRGQIAWLAAAYALLALIALAGFVANRTAFAGTTFIFMPAFDVLIPAGMVGVAGALGVAIFRHHLYDVDVFIRRAVVYAALLAIITALYVVVVVSVGTRIGSGHNTDPAVPIVVAALAALAVQPLRGRLNRLANRLVYGRRATPYDVLSRFGAQVSEVYAGGDVPLRMARLLAEGTRADRAEVWLAVAGSLRREAAWPGGDGQPEPVPLDGAVPVMPGVAAQAEVRYGDDLLGLLTVVKREPLTAVETRLLTDAARQASLMLKNAGMNAELADRLEELRRSRQRLVAAQQEERRRIERDLHDGAQQNLVALKIRLGLAKMQVAGDPTSAGVVLDGLAGEVDEAIDVLRRFAHGIYPPILEQRGLRAALEAHVSRLPLDIEVTAPADLPRAGREHESAVYFCVLEALQNVQKHARARTVRVRLEAPDGRLEFSVEDDGVGVDPRSARLGRGVENMADRLAALGGSLEIAPREGGGTVVRGSVPGAGAVSRRGADPARTEPVTTAPTPP